MAKKEADIQSKHQLMLETVIDVICIKGERIIKVTKTFEEALMMEKKEGWKYINYQKDYSSFTENK